MQVTFGVSAAEARTKQLLIEDVDNIVNRTLRSFRSLQQKPRHVTLSVRLHYGSKTLSFPGNYTVNFIVEFV